MSNFEYTLNSGDQGLYEVQPLTDAELAERIRCGDLQTSNDAFTELWQRHEGLVANIARRNGANQDTEDILQETALKLWSDLKKNKRDFSKENNARNFAGRIAANKTVDSWRYKSRRPEDLIDEYHDGHITTPLQSSPEEVVVSETVVNDLLGQVRPERRGALRALYLDGYSADEYAEQTDMPRGTVLSRAHRGRKELHAILENEQVS